MFRLLLIVFALVALSFVPFLIWGGQLEQDLTRLGAAGWMQSFGNWAWVAGIGLIASDIVLPVPSSAVMGALGIIYGPLLGGAISALGAVIAGLLGYGICRLIGPARAERLAGAEGLAQARQLFERWGGWLVAGSRWLPIFPETVSFLAGLTGMRFAGYLGALACGAIPLGFTFAALGHFGADYALPTLFLCAVAPLLLWLLVRPFLNRQSGI
ncbi:TVP38/TMEM64 family protein [Sulfitobacter sp.]|uniref:TVP38/TMEM64 family protein n=1 Tax=Sulfitobacter sp. TaxID=1903071 RepID=UPI003003A5C6